MEGKLWAIVLGISLLVLAITGVVVHSDLRLAAADLLGAIVVIAVLVVADRGRTAAIAMPILATTVFIIMAVLAVTSHASHLLVALTLAFGFAFAFMSWTTMSPARSSDRRGARRPPLATRP
jgi:hypothetical protein